MATAYIDCPFTGTAGSGTYYKIKIDYTQDVANNQTTATFMGVLKFGSNYGSYSHSGTSISFSVNGTAHNRTNKSWDNPTTETEVWTSAYTQTFTHNADGTLEVQLAMEYVTGTTRLGTVSVSGSAGKWTVPTIPRASTLNSISSLSLEDNITVTFTAHSNTFTHKLKVYPTGNGASGYATLSSYSSGVGKKFTAAQLLSLYGNFGTALPTTAKVVLETYNGSTLIGTDTKTGITLNVGTARMKISGSWKKGVPWVKANGTWHRSIAFGKVSGSWHRGL